MSSCLVFWDESKNKLSDTYSKLFSGLLTFFTWLWLYIPTLQNNLEMLPQPGDMETILDHLLGPIIDRLPKLLLLALDQDL